MTTLKLTGYSGEIPRVQPRNLPDMAAQFAQNVRLTNGALTPIRMPRLDHVISGHEIGAVKTIYKHLGDWYAWDTVVSAAPGPVADERLYVMGDGVPEVIISGMTYPLAVPSPMVALTAVANTSTINRIYFYTNIDGLGVESTASPTLTIAYDSNQRVKLKGFLVPAGIAQQNIYRTEGGITYLVWTRTASTSNYTDIVDTVEPQNPPGTSTVAPPVTALTYELTPKDITTRVYVWTWVTQFDEESQPSDASNEIDWQDGDTVTLSGFTATPAGRGIDRQRIYRSQTTATGANLFLIAERAASTADFIDNLKVDDFAEPLPSLDWTAPTDTMDGLIAMGNGMMVAFDGKEVCFCEPYFPHAWPEKYKLLVNWPVVALGAFGTTVVVMTTGQPYVISGTAPENMTMEKVDINLPCINRRGVVDIGTAIAYPSQDGLVTIGTNGPHVITNDLMSREDWLATGPATFVAGQYNGKYYASYSYTDDHGKPQVGTFIIDLTGTIPFLDRASLTAEACFYDVTDSALYMLQGLNIYQYDAQGQPNETLNWRSKMFVYAQPTSFGAILVEGADDLDPDEQANLDAANAAILANNLVLYNTMPSLGGELNGAALNVYAVNDNMLGKPLPQGFCSVDIYGDKRLICTVTIVGEMDRLPADEECRLWEVQVNTNLEISQIKMARTGQELATI